MGDTRTAFVGIVLAFVGIVLLFTPAATPAASPPPAADPLAAEIARWSAFVADERITDENAVEVRRAAAPVVAQAEQALRDGRRLFALTRLAAVRADLAAAEWMAARGAGERSAAGFEAAWAREGRSLAAAPSPAALEGVRPALLRAAGEAALPQARVYYDASLEYGRNTMPEYGLFYIGAARAQQDFATFCRRLSAAGFDGAAASARPAGSARPADSSAPAAAASPRSPPLRPLAAEIDALDAALVRAYRPPASIERHAEFITASASLKEARELDAAGFRHGALLRYLQAVLRSAPLRAPAGPPAETPDPARLAARLEAAARALDAAVDHSLARAFVEQARADLERPPVAPSPLPPFAIAAAVVDDVLPRYAEALAPARPAPARPAPRATVTLVRWPYT